MPTNYTRNKHNHVSSLNGNHTFYAKKESRQDIAKFKVRKKTQKAKMTIWKWINYRNNFIEKQ